MKYDKIRKNLKQFLSLTGFSLSEFEAFSPTFKHHWDEYHSHFTLKGKARIRVSYGRKSSQLPFIRDKLLFILSYMKNNPFPKQQVFAKIVICIRLLCISSTKRL